MCASTGKISLHRAQYYPCFPTPTGGPGTCLLEVGGWGDDCDVKICSIIKHHHQISQPSLPTSPTTWGRVCLKGPLIKAPELRLLARQHQALSTALTAFSELAGPSSLRFPPRARPVFYFHKNETPFNTVLLVRTQGSSQEV